MRTDNISMLSMDSANKDRSPLDLLLIQANPQGLKPYFVGICALKAFLHFKGFNVKCIDPITTICSLPVNKNILDSNHPYGPTENPFNLQPLTRINVEIFKPYIFDLITAESPKFIGFSLIQGNLILSFSLAQACKIKFPHIPIIMGGPAVLEHSHYILEEWDCLDFLITGEAELPLCELIFGKNPIQIPGLFYRANGKWHNTPSYDREINFASLPLPDYSDFAMNPIYPDYLCEVPINLSRGCPYRCTFCNGYRFIKHHRHYPMNQIIDTIECWKNKGVRDFVVPDPICNGDEAWLTGFCKQILQRKLEISWNGNFRLDRALFKNENIELILDSGCNCFVFGLESASPAVLQHMRKMSDISAINSFFEKLRQEKLRRKFSIFIQLIVGYPIETDQDFEQTLNFVKKNGDIIDDVISCSAFLMLQETTIFKMTKFIEYCDASFWSTACSTPEIRLHRMREMESVFKQCKIPYKMFYMNYLEEFFGKDHAAIK